MQAAGFAFLVLGASGCYSVKAGAHSFAGSAAGPSTNGVAVDLEAHRRHLTSRTRFDWSLFFAYTSFINETGIPAVGGGAYSSENLHEADGGLIGRLFPFRVGAIRPFVGAGVGYFQLYERSKQYTGTCGAFPGWSCRTYRFVDDQISRGPFWKTSVGALIPVTANGFLLFEFQRDGSKSNRGFALEADRLVVGWRTGARR